MIERVANLGQLLDALAILHAAHLDHGRHRGSVIAHK